MRRLFLWLIFIGALSAVAVMLAGMPGMMQFEWAGWRVTLATSLFIAFAGLLLLLVAWLSGVLTRLWSWPERKRMYRQALRHETGLKALTRAAAALAVSDTAGAKKDIAKARRYLDQAPIALLMQAQMHEKQGESGKAAALYHELSAYEETARLGLRGLLATAEKNRDYARALVIATEGLAQFPKDNALLTHTLELMLRVGELEQARALLARVKTRWRLGREQRLHFLALVDYLSAQKAHDDDARLKLLEHAHAHAPWHQHIALTTLDALLASGSGHIRKVLAEEWNQYPSPPLTEFTLRWLNTLPDSRRGRAARKLAARADGQLESHLLLAYDAEARGELAEAREEAEEALSLRESRRALQLIADLEAETASIEKAQPWYTRAANTAAEEQWVCRSCGVASDEWQLFCPSCDTCDSQQLALPVRSSMHIEKL